MSYVKNNIKITNKKSSPGFRELLYIVYALY